MASEQYEAGRAYGRAALAAEVLEILTTSAAHEVPDGRTVELVFGLVSGVPGADLLLGFGPVASSA